MRSSVILGIALLFAGCASFPNAQRPAPVTAVDSGGRPLTELQTGSSLEIAARDLDPRTSYEFMVTLDNEETPISFARLTTDARGRVPQFVLWYQSGVIGCATRKADEARRLKFRSFDEAEHALAGRTLRVRARPSNRESKDAKTFELALPIKPRKSAMVYPSDKDGCLVNSLETSKSDLYVSGRNFTPGETISLSVVENQRAWYVGDQVTDLTGASAAPAPEHVTADANGRFTTRVWDATNEARGTYDIVAQRSNRTRDLSHLDIHDIVSYGSDTGFIFYLYYPPGGTYMDLAGRTVNGFPYFEYADSFADTNDTVWAAVDPTYVPVGHPGGQYAGFIVVNHRTPAQWIANTAIADISQNNQIEVMPVKGGCINVSETPIWPAPVADGQYDVVVDFGASPAANAASWASDGTYDASVDFLDGGIQVGFTSAPDPYNLGPIAVGQVDYSQDDFFPTLGTATNVDLRATVRYPATANGMNAPVAPGTHPLFVIEHGNHGQCRVCKDNTLYYDRLKQAVAGTYSWAQFNTNCSYQWSDCPDRIKNHEGYNHLLDVLASHGVIAVSIDAYDLTGPTPDYISERADLILKHIEMWSHLNTPANFPSYPDPFGGMFNGHVDLSKISVSGHSRGGEASVTAYLHNQALANPFSINSVSSIAPVDFYSPTLPGVPYFVILPAADGDVTSLSGVPIYDRAGSGVNDATTKSGIWVYGANHDFFNTVWAVDWDDYTDGHPAWPARPDFITAADQQKLGEAYLAAFTLTHLMNETVYDDMLRGRLIAYPSTSGKKIYNFRHETNHNKIDAGSGTGAAGGGTTASSIMNPSVHQTQALRLGWPSFNADYTWTFAPKDVSGFEVLSFRVAQTNAASNPAGGQYFRVELSDGAHIIGTYTSTFFPIPKPYVRPDVIHNLMTTVRIPLHTFIVNNSQLDLTNVNKIHFLFWGPSTGEIYVDDVEFSR